MSLEAEVSSVIPYAISVAAAALGLWWRIESRVSQERTEREASFNMLVAAREKAVEIATADIKSLEDRLRGFELEAARSFVSVLTQEKMETRFMTGIDKLTSRLETLVARMEGLGNQQTRIEATIKRVDEVVQNGRS